MHEGILSTPFDFAGQTGKYTGKVREVYSFGDRIAMIATDRISAFDVVLPHPIPFKGQVLNQIAARFLKATEDIVPNWVESVPDPNVTMGKKCEPFKVEMVIRGYLAGHAWREYKDGKRAVCGNSLPDGLQENDKLPRPIITPTTKADQGHDEDISRDQIIQQGIVSQQDLDRLEQYTFALFERGTEIATTRGLILVDTKYEFGKKDGTIYLIDEIHTPDSSRYFYADTYDELQQQGAPQRQLSKEFVRKWLIEHDFQGLEGQQIPEIPSEFIRSVSDRYIELFEKITGDKFVKERQENVLKRIEDNINKALKA
ncbi:MAG: phosphoribosylaminoimidazolesuccinocarboxamide synthase [Cyclobacteriaceae bacterium]|nr:phosphoribosylaminoimidazolesuccinocarboxamide synthase [Cyclobacteriaceae bacterium HetDA_MAG_MS6]